MRPLDPLWDWLGDCGTESDWRALVNCYPGIEFVVRNAPADIYPTFAPERDGQFFRSGNRP